MSAVVLRRFPTTNDISAMLLADLEEAHQRLLEAMAALDELTGGPLPMRAELIDARWNISRASLARRTLWTRIHAHLSDHMSDQLAAELTCLQQTDRTLLRWSGEHVSKWTIDTALRDWPAYCEASRQIRWKMAAAIGGEKRFLYPALSGSDIPRAV